VPQGKTQNAPESLVKRQKVRDDVIQINTAIDLTPKTRRPIAPNAKDYFATNAIGDSYAENIDGGKSKTYDNICKLIESVIFHKVLVDQHDVPLFLRIPTETSKNYKQIMNEWGAGGFLNFNIILQKLKSKKYGPGRNNIKVDAVLADLRNVFNVCEKFYSYDPTSLRISRTLESFFENEVKVLQGGGRASSKDKTLNKLMASKPS